MPGYLDPNWVDPRGAKKGAIYKSSRPVQVVEPDGTLRRFESIGRVCNHYGRGLQDINVRRWCDKNCQVGAGKFFQFKFNWA